MKSLRTMSLIMTKICTCDEDSYDDESYDDKHNDFYDDEGEESDY